MTAPFLRAHTDLLVSTCHRRGAFAIGGMSAFIPSRRDEQVNGTALEKVRADKTREAAEGFDGSWVAHPGLVPVCAEVFDARLGRWPNQLGVTREDVQVRRADLLAFDRTPGAMTGEGLSANVDVALRYLAAWLGGLGAVALHNLMEDVATAEISRSQIWQWINANTRLADGTRVSRDLVSAVLDDCAGCASVRPVWPDSTTRDGSRSVATRTLWSSRRTSPALWTPVGSPQEQPSDAVCVPGVVGRGQADLAARCADRAV
jgi:malate synthase